MFNFFEKEYDNPALIEKIKQTQNKWISFLEKLEARMKEMCMGALPELKEVFEQDNDPYKRAHGRMVSALQGQLGQMREKANEVKEEKVFNFVHHASATIPPITTKAGRKYDDMLYAFRQVCLDRHRIFEEKIHYYFSLLKGTTGQQDLEADYQEQLTAFESIKDKFGCKQCGGNITIPKLFFIATYVTCPFCHTQNTFLPSTATQLVFHNARSLAEQRTAHLLKAYEESETKAPGLYQQYLRSMFDEWNKIVPDMAEENEKFYQRLLKDNSIDHH
ncbi:hypothetical protein CLV51_104323 [Chitinophaga niastensis]|uniref:Uncharacterized protein n=1 Tax=Chitinophaga niastensis TaxID=536980 RepID=A0A2P8HHC8_CHINA|nr:hypothetical protein [Chitinophaga niastensis]PSL45617.1 hypothetical protein CLV51_104323 [Chitinophaga niastensis]